MQEFVTCKSSKHNIIATYRSWGNMDMCTFHRITCDKTTYNVISLSFNKLPFVIHTNVFTSGSKVVRSTCNVHDIIIACLDSKHFLISINQISIIFTSNAAIIVIVGNCNIVPISNHLPCRKFLIEISIPKVVTIYRIGYARGQAFR